MIRHYTFSEADLSIIRQRCGQANRLGFVVQFSYLRFPGIILGVDEPPFPPLLKLIADQLKVSVESWNEYGQREQTRCEHLIELQTVFGFQTFTMSHYRQAAHTLTELAMQTDKGVVLADALIDRRYSPEFLEVLKLRAAPAAKDMLDAIEVLRGMNSDNARKVPADAPTDFIKPRWQKLVMTDTGIDRRYYELCALSELKNALRSGDIWVQGSRQFKDFEDYLVPPVKFASLKQASDLPLAVWR